MHSVIEMKGVYPLGSVNVLANFMVFFPLDSVIFCQQCWHVDLRLALQESSWNAQKKRVHTLKTMNIH